MTNRIFYFFTFIFSVFFNAQKIEVVDTNNKALANVLIFDKSGNILAKTNIDGNFDKEDIEPLQESYILKQENAIEDIVDYEDFRDNVIRLNNKIVQIPEVIINSISNPNFVIIHGYFNNYVTLNNKLNCYVDGIIEYTFDYKTKKYISYNLIQYRTYVLKEKNADRKNISTFSFDTMVKVPELEKLNHIEEIKNNPNVVSKEIIDTEDNRIRLEFSSKKMQDKIVNLFGYRFTEGASAAFFSFSKTENYDLLKNLYSFNRTYQMKVKHKTEENFNILQGYSNFYPEKIYYLKDKSEKERIKLNKNKSNYTDEYWENSILASTYNLFSSFFKNNLEEQPNTLKK